MTFYKSGELSNSLELAVQNFGTHLFLDFNFFFLILEQRGTNYHFEPFIWYIPFTIACHKENVLNDFFWKKQKS